MSTRILPALALIIAIGAFFAYVNPTWTGSIADTQKAIATDDQALVAAQRYIAQQNDLAASRNAIDPTMLKELAAFLPDSVDNVGLILDLNALAARSGLSVSNMDVVTGGASNVGATGPGTAPAGTAAAGTGTTPSTVGSVDLSLSATGTFAALQTFLAGVEQSQRLLDVHDLVVKGSDTGVYSYNMMIRLYWLR